MSRRPVRTIISTLIGAALCSSAYARDDLPNFNVLAAQDGTAHSLSVAGKRLALPGTSSAAVERVLKAGLVADRSDVSINRQLGVPSFVWANPKQAKANIGVLKADLQATAAARDYVSRFAPLYGLDRKTLSGAELKNLHDTGKGVIIAKYRQRVNGIEVFAQELNVAMKRDMSLVSLSGNLSPRAAAKDKLLRAQAIKSGPEVARVAAVAEFELAPDKAVAAAFADMGGKLKQSLKASSKQGDYTIYPAVEAAGDYVLTDVVRSKPVYFDRGDVLEPAYYVELSAGERGGSSSDMYGYVISAKTGEMLFRKDFTENDAYVYRVFADNTGNGLPWDGPQGKDGQPNPLAAPGFVPTFKAPNLVVLESGPISTGDPWLLPIASETAGNNVDAYADLASPDGYFRVAGDFRADVNSFFTVGGTQLKGFNYTLNTSTAANTLNNQRAAIVQLFYTNNWLHDWYYDAGFDEAAGNAQANNFGRGGFDSDPIKAEAQDFSGTNNANMSTPPDGRSPRMQQFLFTHIGDAFIQTSVGKFTVQQASFGPTSFNLPGSFARISDGTSDLGCVAATNPSELAGKIALIQRGTCNFTVKVKNAQNAGAIGAVIYNNAATGLPGMGGADATVTIPAQGISQADGQTIIAALASGAVTATMNSTVVPSRDSTFDNLIVAHEWGHYISNRLVADALGLGNNQGRSMGEGWADFHAMLMTVEEADLAVANNANYGGVYAQGGYADMGPLDPAPQTTFFWGIRRTPYTTDTSKNALTFRHIENGVPLPTNIHPVSFGANGASNSEVHNSGEIWANTLWQAYVNLLNDPRHSFDEAQDLMKNYLVAGYKLTPANPTFLDARDALLAAVRANDDEGDLQSFIAAFAMKGMGAGAVAPDRFSTTHAGVVESFSEGSALESAGLSLDTEATGLSCDADGVLDAGETARLTVRVRNTGFEDLAEVNATLTSSNDVEFADDGVVHFSNVPVGGVAEAVIDVTLKSAATREELVIDAEFTSPQVEGAAVDTFTDTVNFDLVPASTFDDGNKGVSDWTFRTLAGSGTPWQLVSGLLGDDADYIHWGIDNSSSSDTVMESPALVVGNDDNLQISWDQTFNFEFSGGIYWDGGVVEYQVDGGAWQDAGSHLTPAYNAPSLGGDDSNPLVGRPGYGTRAAGFPTLAPASVDLSGLGLAGKTVKLRYRVGSDSAVGADGWLVDNIRVNGVSNLPFTDFGDDAQTCVGALRANAGPDITARAGSFVRLSAIGSTNPEFNATLNFHWSQVSGPRAAISRAETATPRVFLISPTGRVATVVLRVTVTDPDGNTSTDDINITVVP